MDDNDNSEFIQAPIRASRHQVLGHIYCEGQYTLRRYLEAACPPQFSCCGDISARQCFILSGRRAEAESVFSGQTHPLPDKELEPGHRKAAPPRFAAVLITSNTDAKRLVLDYVRRTRRIANLYCSLFCARYLIAESCAEVWAHPFLRCVDFLSS